MHLSLEERTGDIEVTDELLKKEIIHIYIYIPDSFPTFHVSMSIAVMCWTLFASSKVSSLRTRAEIVTSIYNSNGTIKHIKAYRS